MHIYIYTHIQTQYIYTQFIYTLTHNFLLLTMMHYSFQSLNDGLYSWIVFLPKLQETSRDKGLQKGITRLE